jgi:hypothetical protein
VAQIINIPLAFKFSPLKAKWRLRTVEIVGWARDVKKRSLIPYFGSPDSVTVDILEPASLGGLTGLYGMLHIERQYGNLKNPAVLHWSDIPAELKASATMTKDIDALRGSAFNILGCESSEGEYGRAGDAWAMRREFLGLEHDIWPLLAFLRKWGIWDERMLGGSNSASGKSASLQNIVFPERIWELQGAYRAALLGPPDEWLANGVDPFKGAYATPMYPHFIVEQSQCKLAIEATITIDLLRKVKFRACKRPDCSEVFALESRHRKIYCGQPCAHLVSVRKQRRAPAKLKKKSATKKGA